MTGALMQLGTVAPTIATAVAPHILDLPRREEPQTKDADV
jgi:hypothetical protein